jgi:hypothetical protein
MVTVQVPLPEQSPDQPVNVDQSELGFAVKVTLVPTTKSVVQVRLQKRPLAVMRPAPVPDLVTVSAFVGAGVKVAVIDWSPDTAPDICTWQGPVPEQSPPDQPAKR